MLWISTPSHAYLRVDNLKGFSPSTFSRFNDKFYYLEEDADAPNFLAHIWGDEWKSKYIKHTVYDTWTDLDIDTFVATDN